MEIYSVCPFCGEDQVLILRPHTPHIKTKCPNCGRVYLDTDMIKYQENEK